MAREHQLDHCNGRKQQNLRCNSRYIHLLLVHMVLIGVQIPITAGFGYNGCESGQYTCKDGSCILLEKMCDGRLDCLDNSDEVDCDAKKCRAPNWFQCAQPHGPCLSDDLVCNGIANCPGGEDELECAGDVGTGGWLSSKRACGKHEYTCESDKSCIPLDFMCDGKTDCHDGSDEAVGCLSAEANCHGFFCSNKKCLVSKRWICDGIDDCGDSSDERNCDTLCKPELNKFQCRDNVTCLDLAKVCDSHNDCLDRSDESTLCLSVNNNCKTKICPPASKCQMFPMSGPECVCPKGYRYSTLQNACVDINECVEVYGLCSQGCENTSGGYRCTCDQNYRMRLDNRTCEARGDDALLLYSTQVTVMGVHLDTRAVFTVAKNLTKVIGVAYDGESIYWTNIQNGDESIVKARTNGSEQEILLTSGLDAPEDLAVDWLTGNIYFSDNVMRHIAVCSNDGLHCTVLVTIDVHQPRGIALWPQRGQIFWTDWGVKPMIVRASMDGSKSLPIVTENIHWPNGIALDMHNNRIYWVDAKISTMESVRPDGTDRRMILDEILKHPYGLSIFEDNIYWSDWGTKSVHSCNKFTGKNHKVITKDRTIYAVHIYHKAKQPQTTDHPCARAHCSHLCLLAENNRSTCACPENMQLAADKMRCKKIQKRQRLFVGVGNTLKEIEHSTFGRHVVIRTHPLPIHDISEMVYNSVNGTIIVADNMLRTIFEYDFNTNKTTKLANQHLGNVTALAFDHLAQTVYWTDSERYVIEVMSLQTRHRAIVSFFSGMETPIGLAVIPDDGKLFVALRSRRLVHIDSKSLSGRGDHAHVFDDELGDRDIRFASDYNTHTLFWSDSDLGRISFTDYRNLKAYTLRGRLRRPYSVAILDDDFFWSELKSSTIHWTHTSNLGPLKKFNIELNKGTGYSHMMQPDRILLAASTAPMLVSHPCQHDNGGCSHVCVTVGKFGGACLCPAGLVFKDPTNKTCIDSLDCEFRCRSGECLTQSRRCNGRKDCPDGSDEIGCEPGNMKRPKVICTISEFMCHDSKQCIPTDKRCDGTKQCQDGSDEDHCTNFDKSKKCHRRQHACNNGNCVDFSVMCDDVDDCGDNSDELNCKMVAGEKDAAATRPMCDKDMFQCNSGTCIAQSWECDGKLDCSDGSDEHDKCELKDCPKEMHKCSLGQCIDARLVCDEHDDCGDMSDELNCDSLTGRKRNQTCGDEQRPMYQCSSNPSLCLAMTAKCNGTAECPRGEDEADCDGLCSIYEFKCKTTKECIRMEFRCDHERDCEDGSDELNCDRYTAMKANATNAGRLSHERACEANMFDCKDGQCVDMTRVCNGFDDCDTGADESPLCHVACKGPSGRGICSQDCHPTPDGAVCSCSNGYKLDDDQRSCIDINECDELDICSQLCQNTQGSYRCSCYPDFMLRTDKTTCKSIESDSSLLFATFNEVRRMTEQPITLRVAWSSNDSKITGFDLNVRKRSAYFTVDNEDVLYMFDMNGSGQVKAGLTVQMPTKVAVDWITDNVYVISRNQRYEIQTCSFAAKMCSRVIEANPRETIKAIAMDAYNRRLFFVTVRSPSFGLPMSQIIVANPDGKNREILITKVGSYITSIATDPYKKLLYYVDSHKKTLSAISYKLKKGGQNPMTIVQKGNVIVHPSGLTVYENHAFIVNMGAKEAIRCQLFGSRTCNAFNLNIRNAEDIVVDGASRQPHNPNPCAMAKCQGICIQAAYGYECLCGDSIVEEHVQCAKEHTNEITSSALLLPSNNNGDNDNDTHTSHLGKKITIWLLIILASVGIGAGYLYYRRVQPVHRDFNINLHFQNPLSSWGSGGKLATATNNISNTAAAYEGEREKMEFNTPIYRFFHGATSKGGSEILLETKNSPSQQGNGMGQGSGRMPCIMVGEYADDDIAGTDRHCDDDDARARLVP